jgi:2-iminobutanoate/2-iminopropanoate deaminase
MAAKKVTSKKVTSKKVARKKAAPKTTKAKTTKAKKSTSKAAAPVGPYTPVVRAGDWVIVSGQLGLKDGVMAKGVAAQTAQAVVNLKARLAEAGVTINDVKKTLCFLTDMDTFATFNEAYVAGFGKSRPARSTIGVASLPAGGQVEIEAWAYKPLR